MDWKALESADQIEGIKQHQGYSIIFKHSTRCPTSMIVKRRFETDRNKLPDNIPLYFLDLIKYRILSGQVAHDFDVEHESPQMLLIKDGMCILDLSHGQVSVQEALSLVKSTSSG